MAQQCSKKELQKTVNAVAKLGSKNAAAEQLKLSPSTITNRLQRAKEQGVKPTVKEAPRNKGSNKPLSLADAKEAVWAVEKYGNNANAAKGLGIPESTLRLRLDIASRLYELTPDVTKQTAKTIERLTKELREARKELEKDDSLREELYRLSRMPIDPPQWSVKTHPATTGPGIPILFTSDFQWGEKVTAEELDGINEFNEEIAIMRYRRLIERTVDLCYEHMVSPQYPGLIYLRGGDMINGEIHDEFKETNELQSLPAVQSLVSHELWGIRQLADKFGKIRVITVPGNHGRLTKKPHSKKYALHNYDTHSAWLLETMVKAMGDDRISFWTPLSGDALFPVFGWQFLLTHGDRIGSRGGQGFIGPAATITRGMKKLRDYYAELGRPVDYILVGHFHTAMELEFGFANGSLPGYTEYARDGRMTPKPAVQWLLFVHPKHGVTARWKVALDQTPSTREMRSKLRAYEDDWS